MQFSQGFPKKETNWTKGGGEPDEVYKSIADIASSIRVLEDRYMNLRRKSQLTDQSLIDFQKDYYKEKKHINEEITEAKIKLQELIEELKIIREELKDTVKQKDLKILDKYLDLWEPMQFVTRNEVKKMLED